MSQSPAKREVESSAARKTHGASTGLALPHYRKSGGEGDLASNNHYGELTRYSLGIQLGTSTVHSLVGLVALGGAAASTGAADWLSN
jgi:hypothetical protein